MLTDLLAIEGHLSILLSELPEDLSPEATSSLLGALLRLRRVIGRETTKTPPMGLLEPLEEALADIESHANAPTPQSTWASNQWGEGYRVGQTAGYRAALRYAEAARDTMAQDIERIHSHVNTR